MKCREVMERAVDPVTAVECEEVRAHMEACEACRRQLEVFHALQRTIALKRYERRREQREHLCALAVRRKVGALRASPGWSVSAGIPPLRLFVLVASGIVLMIGVYFAVHLLHHFPEDTPPFALEEDAALHARRDLSGELPLIEEILRMNRPLWNHVEARPRLPGIWIEDPTVDVGSHRPADGTGYRVLTGLE